MDKKEIYRSIIVNHSKHPNKFTNDIPKDYKKFKSVSSVTCSDNFDIYLKINNNKIKDAVFSGTGCAISTSSLNIFCERIIGKSKEEVSKLVNDYTEYVLNGVESKDLKDLLAFGSVKNYPNRIECALLAPKTLRGWIDEK